MRFRLAWLLLSVLLFSHLTCAQAIKLSVDLTDAPRNIYHSRLSIPAKPGPLTLVFPKWIPGNHRPSGPIANLVDLEVAAAGHPIGWQRDPVDMYAFHVNVPAGTNLLDVSFDAITSSGSAGATGAAASSNLLDLNWNTVVLYPKGMDSDNVEVVASVRLPAGWKFGTALPVQRESASTVEFRPASLTRLVDSPLIAGDHCRRITLSREPPIHVMDIVSESEAALQMSPEDEAAYRKLVAETGALFGARHYRDYHFLLTLSDEVGHHGLEHHESSDNSTAERTLINSDLHLLEAGLIPHEFVHSWNGKYRRPAGLATPNYQEPMIGDLLWVYEGLTEYLGDVLTARSGLWTPEEYRDALAETAAMLDHRAGRKWRPLEDTARSVQILRLEGPEWENWRRSLDYYPEGELIWLQVDNIIRQQSGGRKSLDNFCQLFHGGQSGPPKVLPYAFSDIVQTLNEVVAYDWAGLLKALVDSITTHPPLGGIEHGGWQLVYNEEPSAVLSAREKTGKYLDASYSLGFLVKDNGELIDVIPGSPAYSSGIGPGMKIIAVNGHAFSRDMLRDSLRASRTTQSPMELLVENAHFFRTYSVDYYGGERIPHLQRAGGPDILDQVLKPLTH